jgi:hypothetical protein
MSNAAENHIINIAPLIAELCQIVQDLNTDLRNAGKDLYVSWTFANSFDPKTPPATPYFVLWVGQHNKASIYSFFFSILPHIRDNASEFTPEALQYIVNNNQPQVLTTTNAIPAANAQYNNAVYTGSMGNTKSINLVAGKTVFPLDLSQPIEPTLPMGMDDPTLID